MPPKNIPDEIHIFIDGRVFESIDEIETINASPSDVPDFCEGGEITFEITGRAAKRLIRARKKALRRIRRIEKKIRREARRLERCNKI